MHYKVVFHSSIGPLIPVYVEAQSAQEACQQTSQRAFYRPLKVIRSMYAPPVDGSLFGEGGMAGEFFGSVEIFTSIKVEDEVECRCNVCIDHRARHSKK